MHVQTPDGRILEVLVAGPEDGFPLVYLHGTPTGIVADPEFAEASLRRAGCG